MDKNSRKHELNGAVGATSGLLLNHVEKKPILVDGIDEQGNPKKFIIEVAKQ